MRRRAQPSGQPPPELKPVTFLMLMSLAEGERHGYALKKDVFRRTGGRLRLGPGTLYRTIRQMLDAGLIEESDRRPAPELDDERRHYYRITTHGRRVAAEEARRLASLVGAARAARLLDDRGPA
jgi:DNA-binding PadR family transcriptional regulator